MKLLKVNNEEKEKRSNLDNKERLLTALCNIPIAILELIRFVIKNAPWMALGLVGCATALIILVPECKDMFVQALEGALK